MAMAATDATALAPAAGEEPLVELRNVTKAYPVAGEGRMVTILDDVSLQVNAGEMLALLGQSGSGKSTLLRLMAGLTQPTRGGVMRHGHRLEGVNPDIAIVFQSFALYPWLTVEENVRVGLIRRHLSRVKQDEAIASALELIGLSGYENAFPKELSGGMRQRVGFARALVARPEILAMDEAFSALDVLTAENLRSEVVDLWRRSEHGGIKSIFFVTHNIAEAVFMASRILIISSHPGRIRHAIDNPIPYPRDENSPGFLAMVDQIHAAITALALPDEPAETAAVRTSPKAPTRTRIETIPSVPVSTIIGLLETLEASRETIDVFELAADIGKDFGETIGIVKAAEMLNLVDTPKDDVRMTQLGWYFLAAPPPARKTLFRQAIMKLRLFQMMVQRLDEAPDHRVDAEDIRSELATLLPYEQPSKLFDTLITWGRYAEIVDYDEGSDTVTMQMPEAEQDDDE